MIATLAEFQAKTDAILSALGEMREGAAKAGADGEQQQTLVREQIEEIKKNLKEHLERVSAAEDLGAGVDDADAAPRRAIRNKRARPSVQVDRACQAPWSQPQSPNVRPIPIQGACAKRWYLP